MASHRCFDALQIGVPGDVTGSAPSPFMPTPYAEVCPDNQIGSNVGCPSVQADDSLSTRVVVVNSFNSRSQSDSQSTSKYSEYEKAVYAQILDDLYENMLKEQESLTYTPYSSEWLMDNAYTARMRGKKQFKQSPKMADLKHFDIFGGVTLKIARRRGFSAMCKIFFPTVKMSWFWECVANVWILGEFLFILLGLILSIFVVVSTDELVPIFTWVHLGISSFGTILAVFDLIGSFRPCHCTCKANTACSKCNCMKSTLKIGRIVAAELIITPSLICDFFDLFIGMGYHSEDRIELLGFALFVVDSAALIFFMYFARILIMASSLKSMHKLQTSKEEYSQDSQDEQIIRKRAFYFAVFIVFHSTLQLIGHFVMLVSVGAQIRYENQYLFEAPRNQSFPIGPAENQSVYESDLYTTRSPFEPHTTQSPLESLSDLYNYTHSPYLLYMCSAVCVTPILGMLSFFIYANFWFQEFPISVVFDFIKLVQTPAGKDIMPSSDTVKDNTKILSQFMRKIVTAQKTIKDNFMDLYETDLKTKLFYPFRNPLYVIFSILFALFQFGFYYCAGAGASIVAPVVPESQWLNLYTIVAAVFIVVINLYVYAIAVYWIISITIIVITQILIVLYYILLVLSFCIAVWNCITCQE